MPAETNPPNWPKGLRRISRLHLWPNDEQGFVEIVVRRINRQTGLEEDCASLGAMTMPDFLASLEAMNTIQRERDTSLTLMQRLCSPTAHR